jgi:hypothetical protein
LITVSPSQADIQAALRAFLIAILPAGVSVVEGQDNRIPEPASPNFVVMTPILRNGLSTPVDDNFDAVFTGAIAGATMTISAVQSGALAVGSTIFGAGVAANTMVTALGTGTGGIGTYTVSPAQTVGSETLAAGTRDALLATEVTIQLDVHSDDVATASDMAQTIATLMGDAFAVEFFTASYPGITPLYADTPRQMPFINDQNQSETRWVVGAHLQANQVVAATVTPVSVTVAYPT